MAQAQAADTATKAHPHPRDIIICPICVDVLQNPVTLDCFHHICKVCLYSDNEGDKSTEKILCPVCDHTTKKVSEIPNAFLLEMIDWYQHGKTCKQTCDQCAKGKSEATCIDCKMSLCSDCQLTHQRIPLLQNHKIVPLQANRHLVIDRVVFCPKHEKPIEMNCVECEVGMCVKCKVEDHSTHATETTEGASERIQLKMKENLTYMNKVTKVKAQAVEYLRKSIADVKKEFSDSKEVIRSQRNDLLKYIDECFKKLMEEVDTNEKKEVSELQKIKVTQENSIKHIAGVTTWAKTLFESAAGKVLLEECQKGQLRSKVEQLTKELKYSKPIKIQRQWPSYEALSDLPSRETIFGKHSRKHSLPVFIDVRPDGGFISGVIPHNPNSVNLPKLGQKFWKKDKTFACTQVSTFAILKNNLFALPTNNIVNISTQSGELVQTFKFDHLKEIKCLIQNASDIIIGSTSGLFCVNIDGNFKYKIAEGDFLDLTSEDDVIYGLEKNKGQVCKIVNTDRSWKMETLFFPDNFPWHERGSILATDQNIFICSYQRDKIFKFSKTGKLISEFGHSGKGKGPGQLYIIFLCTTDADGNILMCDKENNRLQILKADGQWEVINLQDLAKPVKVFVEDETTLWVLCSEGKKLVKYVFMA